MKRSAMPARTKPLEQKSPLKRATALNASPLARSAVHAREAKRANQPKRARDTGPSKAVRALVAVRSEGWCEWHDCWLVAAEVHHRLNRKNGGRHGEAAVRINQPAWLLHACRRHHSLVTSPVGADRALARESGWLLHEHEDALSVPVLSRHGLVLLENDGTHTPTTKED
ncbi:hypothetical protein [Paractinoplanes maris]|uniref:hypothetical protein n=1 Tax=Paractinoplanes maris TaxID=1734446 RepID=UPI0020208CFF|nr:hypothetical protein [Actinoplanes maris]